MTPPTAPVAGSTRDDLVVLLDDDGSPVGTAPRLEVHGPDTPLHLAFSVYLVDRAGRVLLTRRALSKATWPGVWTNSCCGHPRPGEDPRDAVRRRVREELGLDLGAESLGSVVSVLPDYRYRAVDASGTVEHEVCPVFAATLDAPTDGDETPGSVALQADPREVAEVAWVAWDDLVAVARRAPMLLSPWCVEQVSQLDAQGGLPRYAR